MPSRRSSNSAPSRRPRARSSARYRPSSCHGIVGSDGTRRWEPIPPDIAHSRERWLSRAIKSVPPLVWNLNEFERVLLRARFSSPEGIVLVKKLALWAVAIAAAIVASLFGFEMYRKVTDKRPMSVRIHEQCVKESGPSDEVAIARCKFQVLKRNLDETLDSIEQRNARRL
jgi:hypothetical protein